MEKECFFNTFKRLASEVEPFWYDAYLSDLPRLQRAVLEKAEACAPDLIFFIPYTDQFDVETLDALKSRWTTLAWFGDDTWRFRKYSALMSPHFTYAATTDPFSVGAYLKLGVKPLLTQWAARTSGGVPTPLPVDSYDYDVSFVGGHNHSRAWYVRRIEEAGIPVKCFGAGWPGGKVSFSEMDNIFRRSKINLNLSNSVNPDIRYLFSGVRTLVNFVRSPKRAEQIKARNFEIPLAGGFQVTNYVRGLEHYLSIGGEVVVFASPEECVDQVRFYLENDDERLRILAAGHERARREHTYDARLHDLLLQIWGRT